MLGQGIVLLLCTADSLADWTTARAVFSTDTLRLQVPWYSQFKEDKFLYETFFANKKGGFYLEMGAQNGLRISNTRWFAEAANWRGLLIEAAPGDFLQQVSRLLLVAG